MWEPQEGGTSWKIDQRPFSSHSKSVEDLQWSPTEATVRLLDNGDVAGQTEVDGASVGSMMPARPTQGPNRAPPKLKHMYAKYLTCML